MSGDIRYGDGISISVSVAAVVVDVIGLAEKLLGRQNGQPLPTKLRDIRDDLSDCIARAAANADASTKELTAETVLTLEKTPAKAAEALGLTAGGVRWACQKGHLGRKVGDRWLISDEEIEIYRQTYQRGVA